MGFVRVWVVEENSGCDDDVVRRLGGQRRGGLGVGRVRGCEDGSGDLGVSEGLGWLYPDGQGQEGIVINGSWVRSKG